MVRYESEPRSFSADCHGFPGQCRLGELRRKHPAYWQKWGRVWALWGKPSDFLPRTQDHRGSPLVPGHSRTSQASLICPRFKPEVPRPSLLVMTQHLVFFSPFSPILEPSLFHLILLLPFCMSYSW